jgi:hypothetical protein
MTRLFLSFTFVLVAAACGGSQQAADPEAPPVASEPSPDQAAPGGACQTQGCSNTICGEPSDSQVMTTCEWRAQYECYKSAACERQPDGKCGWTQTAALTACLTNPPPVQ